ncbi:MAG: YeiH family protein [Arachnia sp.]
MAQPRETPRPARIGPVTPGLSLCTAAAIACYAASSLLGGLSPLILAIVLGIAMANTLGVPPAAGPGIEFSAKKLLRAGIVLLGLRLVLTDIAALGAPMLLVIVGIVTGGILGTVALGRLLRVPTHLSLLVACGFSICGAAAVAGAAGVMDPDDERESDTVTAVALVVILGSLMIPLVPLAAGLLGLDQITAGLWAGGSIHEIAQVVAVGSILGGGALTAAVVVKLARVLLLAPVVAALSLRQRSLDGASPGSGCRPPIVPAFILGFMAVVLVRTFVPLPEMVLQIGSAAQTLLLAAAMFALGCGVKVRQLMRVGLRPFLLAGVSTLLVSGIAYLGVALAR